MNKKNRNKQVELMRMIKAAQKKGKLKNADDFKVKVRSK